jgi:hypothetical protein
MDGTDVGAYRTNPFRGTHLAFFLRLLLQAQHEQEGARWPPPPLMRLRTRARTSYCCCPACYSKPSYRGLRCLAMQCTPHFLAKKV